MRRLPGLSVVMSHLLVQVLFPVGQRLLSVCGADRLHGTESGQRVDTGRRSPSPARLGAGSLDPFTSMMQVRRSYPGNEDDLAENGPRLGQRQPFDGGDD